MKSCVQMLRHWQVPGAPPEMEEGLRRAFRAPACAAAPRAVALAGGVRDAARDVAALARGGACATSCGAGAGHAPASQPSPTQAVDRDQASGSTSVAVPRARTRRPATPPRPEPEVIVEPAQAELLAEFGRELWEARQAAPGATIPQMPDVEVLLYREEWEAVAGEWPQSVPIDER